MARDHNEQKYGKNYGNAQGYKGLPGDAVRVTVKFRVPFAYDNVPLERGKEKRLKNHFFAADKGVL
jgi:hypothetical protein